MIQSGTIEKGLKYSNAWHIQNNSGSKALNVNNIQKHKEKNDTVELSDTKPKITLKKKIKNFFSKFHKNSIDNSKLENISEYFDKLEAQNYNLET